MHELFFFLNKYSKHLTINQKTAFSFGTRVYHKDTQANVAGGIDFTDVQMVRILAVHRFC